MRSTTGGRSPKDDRDLWLESALLTAIRNFKCIWHQSQNHIHKQTDTQSLDVNKQKITNTIDMMMIGSIFHAADCIMCFPHSKPEAVKGAVLHYFYFHGSLKMSVSSVCCRRETNFYLDYMIFFPRLMGAQTQPEQPVGRAFPDARWWPDPLHRLWCGGQLLNSAHRAVPPSWTPNCTPICPQTRDFALYTGGASATSRRVGRFSVCVFGWRVSQCNVVRHRASVNLRCTVAPLSLRLPAANRAGDGRMLNRTAALIGRCPQLPRMDAGWGGLVGMG